MKREKQVEGAKERWWSLFLLDSIILHAERTLSGERHKLQLEYQQYSCTENGPCETSSQVDGYASVSKRRSFNQHLALQLSVFNSYIEAIGEANRDTVTLQDFSRPIHVTEVESSGWGSFSILKCKLIRDFNVKPMPFKMSASNDQPVPEAHVVPSTAIPDEILFAGGPNLSSGSPSAFPSFQSNQRAQAYNRPHSTGTGCVRSAILHAMSTITEQN